MEMTSLTKETRTEEGGSMKLLDLVNLMNIAKVGVASKTIPELLPEKPLDMFNLDSDPILQRFANQEVESITNVANLGITIWIR